MHLLNEKPLAQIKVTELCKSANVNRGTFYLHYGEVSDLFKEFFEEMMIDLKESYEAPYHDQPVLNIDTLSPKSIRIFHHVKKYESFYRIVFSKNTPIIYYYMLLEEIKLNIVNSIHHEQISQSSFSVTYRANAILGVVIEWYNNDFEQSVNEMNNILVELLQTLPRPKKNGAPH